MYNSNISYHGKLLKNLPESYKAWFNLEVVYLRKLVKKNSRFLDVGCGNGRILKQLVGVAKDLVGVDHNKIAVKNAKDNLKGNKNVEIILSEARRLPFPDDHFDLVYSNSLVNFGKDKKKALEEMKRVLKKRGKIILSVYSEESLPERLKLYKRLKIPIKEIKKDGTVIFEFDESLGDNLSEQFSRKGLISLFNQTRMNILEIRKVGIGYICVLSK